MCHPQVPLRAVGMLASFLDGVVARHRRPLHEEQRRVVHLQYSALCVAVDCTEPLLLTVDVPPELTVRELNKATKSFSDSRLIAREHNITVYKAVLPSGGRPAAAKRIRKPLPLHETWTADDDAFLRRQHDNFVRLLGYTITDDIRVLLFELATVVMLRAVVHGPTEDSPQPGRPALTLSWAQRTRIALDAARGLQYLHEAAAVSHWGVSSSKVLLFDGLRAKIADYDVFQQQQRDDELAGGRRVNQSINPYEPPESRPSMGDVAQAISYVIGN
ncbi:hypothetical protein HU200_022092 [Digitaria exilis]|uniref:Protein kinase domain-containing protein n=1 Tax=Digitaria exilis TaxID=1010633 RepID=A0A835CDD6_9POAL|nr:hypothetical protein HU200_022092 [Digitaria exilis]